MSELLTPVEHELIEMLGRCASAFANHVVGNGSTRACDIAEFYAHVHDLQHTVMAQACARAFGSLYRMLGQGSEGGDDEQGE